ncbi:unnamed protein product [Amoebophrya sp. A25]|nr:unnamed protein product [Amoebophrya sp. A25]|eukprot:GSA25T00008441001.1
MAKEFSESYFAKGRTKTASRLDLLACFCLLKLAAIGVYIYGIFSTNWHYGAAHPPFAQYVGFGYGPLTVEINPMCMSSRMAEIEQMEDRPQGSAPATIKWTAQMLNLGTGEFRAQVLFCTELFNQLRENKIRDLLLTVDMLSDIPFLGALVTASVRDLQEMQLMGYFYIGGVILQLLLCGFSMMVLVLYWRQKPSRKLRKLGITLFVLAWLLFSIGFVAYTAITPDANEILRKYIMILTGGATAIAEAFLSSGDTKVQTGVVGDFQETWLVIASLLLLDGGFTFFMAYKFPQHPKERHEVRKLAEQDQMDALMAAQLRHADQPHDEHFLVDPRAEFEDIEGDYGQGHMHYKHAYGGV